MNASCHGGDANLSGDLFDYLSFGYQRHYLSFTRRKRLKPSVQRSQFLSLRAMQEIVLNPFSNRIEQFLIPKRLGQKFYRAGFYSADRHWNVSMGGKEYNRSSVIRVCKLRLKVETTGSGQPHIQYDAIDWERLARSQIFVN